MTAFAPPVTPVVDASIWGDIPALLKLYLVPFLWQALGAVVLWVVGGWLIGVASKLITRTLRTRLDQTLTTYIDGALRVVLKIVLIVAILGVFGVESTSFAALIAAAGVAIGMAWSGLLANFAAGVFLVVLRPFKVGDVITAAGVSGEVKEIGLFATTLDNRNNTRIFVGNNKLFSDNITNHSANPHTRVEAVAQIANGVNPFETAVRLRERIVKIPHVLSNPAPEVGIREFNAAGTLLYIRPYVKGGTAEQEAVLAACFQAISDTTVGLPVPAPYQIHQNVA